jgi:hypothetical protein
MAAACLFGLVNRCKKGGIDNMYRKVVSRTVLRYIFVLLEAFVGRKAPQIYGFLQLARIFTDICSPFGRTRLKNVSQIIRR